MNKGTKFVKYLSRRNLVTAADTCTSQMREKHQEHRTLFKDDVPPRAAYGGKYNITMLPGVGSGPTMMEYVIDVYKTACVPVNFEIISDVGIGTTDRILSSIRRNGVCIKGHIPDTPGVFSNLMLRKDLDLYMYKVHCMSYPNVKCRFQNVDIYVFRQNTEGEYSLLEHESKPGIVESLRIITRSNTLRFARWAYDFARKHRRKKVSIIHKANILKLTDGLFLETIASVGQDYPEIKTEILIIDNACMQMVKRANTFDIILAPNLFGNIIISIICGLIGGHGLIAGQNYSDQYGVFEVGLRSIAFKDKNSVNPVAMLMASVYALYYLKKKPYGDLISDAIYKTLVNDKIQTADLGGKHSSGEFVEGVKKHIKEIIGDCPPQEKLKK